MPKPLLNVKVLNGSMRNDPYPDKDKGSFAKNPPSNYVENTYFLSNTQKVSKVVGHVINNQSMNGTNDDAKAFLNSTLNVSNYNTTETRNGGGP